MAKKTTAIFGEACPKQFNVKKANAFGIIARAAIHPVLWISN
jgi:hypothetical protein